MGTIKKLFGKYRAMSVAAKAAGAYILASLFTKGLGILTTPIFTRIMSEYEIGEFNTFSSWHSLIGTVATLSLASGVFMLAMFEFKEERDAYSSAMLGLSFISSAVAGLIYVINPPFWNKVLTLNTAEVIILLLSFVLIPATEYRMVRLKFEYRYKALVAISLTNAILGTGLSLGAVLVCKYFNFENLAIPRIAGLYAVLCTMGLANGIFIIVKGKKLFNKRFWKFALIHNTPIIPNTLANHVLETSDRLMITNMINKGATGIYSTLYTASMIPLIVISAVNVNILPFNFEKLKNNEEHKIAAVVSPILFVIACVCLLLSLVAPEVVRILAPEKYYSAIYIMPPVACGMFFTALSNLFGNILLYHKKTYLIMISTITAAASNVALNYVCIQQFGYFAAAYTTLASYIILAAMQSIFMKIVHRKSVYNMKFIIPLSVALVACSLLCLLLYPYTIIRYIIVLAFLVLAIIFRKKLIALFKAIKKKDKEEPAENNA